jgi:hypothetical protein
VLPGSKFEYTMFVTAFELAREGLSDKQIAHTLGVAYQTFKRWCQRYAALADAVIRGRHRRDPGDELTFHQYIFDHLSPALQTLWKQIDECENLENPVERVEALLKGHGVRVRQHLFLYAFTQSVFNVSQSLRKLGIPRKTFESWCANDPDFAQLIDEMHWHKANFIEAAFMGRIVAGDTAAIIHAVKTKCRDRGYNEKIEVEHTGTVTYQHQVAITELDLPVEVLRVVLDALRQHQQRPALIDARADGIDTHPIAALEVG